jgi:GAF domain-containing protein
MLNARTPARGNATDLSEGGGVSRKDSQTRETEMQEDESIRTAGAPSMTDAGVEVCAFHLNRYLSDWVADREVERLYVTVGFEGSACEGVTFDLTPPRCEQVEVGWSFSDLCHAYRSGDGRLRLEQRREGGGPDVFEILPLLDRAATGGEPCVILGFLLLPAVSGNLPESVELLRDEAGEALRAAKRNGVRMFFDDREARPVKEVLYEMLDHLPEWFGCDHSASLLMTSTLETMALEASRHGRFDVLAERLYFSQPDDVELDRLVGMSILLDGEGAELLQHVVERQLADPELPYQIYERREDRTFCALGEDEPGAGEYHRIGSRPDEEQLVFVPLKIQERHETELLGFLCLAYRDRVQLSSADGALLSTLSQRLSSLLRYSPLYTLGAQKLWILRRTRDLVEKAVTGGEGDIEELIEGVTSLIEHQGAVPSFAIGYVEEEPDDGRVLRYVHPHGWTHFEELTLPVDVPPDERAGSGVSALSVRLDRAFVLAGGRGEGPQQEFKNFVQVHEASGEVVDARSPQAADRTFGDGWRRLGEYYKPARWRAYATLAHPISFGGEVLGVLTVEVEKETDWVWWTGFGGQLFWEMLADKLADAFWTLRNGS